MGNLPPADVLIISLLAVAVATHFVRSSGSKLGLAPYAISGVLMLAARAADL